MSSDISRQRFEPTKDFAAVLMQQGRVLLDADWNEGVEIFDRRLRAETTDTIGHCVVPKETPQGFEIALSGTNLTIGPGRIYVHGILAEQHGQTPLEWDPVLAELRGTAAIPYEQQPYLKDPTLIASPPQEGGPHLVYLDVWRREVTGLEDPGLVESAVGVDSTSRWQTVWQVRVLPDINEDATCESEIAKFEQLTRPSAGRLTTDTFNAPADPDPCQVPPTGRYKGLENRLYRVEIHSVDPGTGAATFKWARHNASVATAVREIKGQDLAVDLIGRDRELRFKDDDWVEITDDARELAGLPGFMRKIKVPDATRTIAIELPQLPAVAFPSGTLKERHTRVRRWDQAGQVRKTDGITSSLHHDLNSAASEGVIPVLTDGNKIILEDGITVEFSLDPTIPGGQFRVGDYWVFAARTADASAEPLQKAPPHGIHHHYCRLALVTFPGTVNDCRKRWPPEFGDEGCDCSVCVTSDSHNEGTLTVQQAIDQVKDKGGTVCLGPGIYNVNEKPISVIGAKSVRLRGQGWATILVHAASGPGVVIRNSVEFAMEHLAVLTYGQSEGSADVELRNSTFVTVAGCYFLQIGIGREAKAAIGLGGVLVQTRICDNLFSAGVGLGGLTERRSNDSTNFPPPDPLLTLGLVCNANQFLCPIRGISLVHFTIHLGETRIERNAFHDARQGGIVVTGAVLGACWGGSCLDIVGNTLRTLGDGIVMGTDDTRINGNDIGPASAAQSGGGIVVERGLLQSAVDHCQIMGNRVHQLEGDGIVLRAPVGSVMIKQNVIEGVKGSGIFMGESSAAGHLSIENNQLLEVGSVTAKESDNVSFLAGIHLLRARSADISNNVLDGIGRLARLTGRLAGIQAVGCTRARIDGNSIVNLGPPDGLSHEAEAIAVIGSFEEIEVTNNSIRRSDTVPANTFSTGPWRALRVGQDAKPFSFRTVVVARVGTTEALLVPSHGYLRSILGENVGVRGNGLALYGDAPAVGISVAGKCLFSDNQANLLAPENIPVLVLQASAAVLNANHFERPGPPDMEVARLHVTTADSFTVLGNITTGRILVNDEELKDPWKPLNVIAP